MGSESKQIKLKNKFNINIVNIFIYLLITIIFIILGYLIITNFLIDNVSPFISNYDGKNYTVRKVGDINNRQTAANYLAYINAKVNTLVDYMNMYNLPDLDTSKRLYHRWMSIELKETNSNEKSVAYTLNKSTEIRICIRDQYGNFEDPNITMFVILHELAHVMSISYNHTEEFKNNFNYITHLASNLGLYKPDDFTKMPIKYCGITINTTPCQNNSCSYKIIDIK